jgi:hypothetical protein
MRPEAEIDQRIIANALWIALAPLRKFNNLLRDNLGHAPFALKVQCKVSNGVAGLAGRRIISGSAQIAAIPCPLSD